MNEWLYTLRWGLRHIPCPGERELARAVVNAGERCPESVLTHWTPGGGYVVCLDFLSVKPIKHWSDERKAEARKRNLTRRVMKAAPLFADELIERELTEREDYFRGKSR